MLWSFLGLESTAKCPITRSRQKSWRGQVPANITFPQNYQTVILTAETLTLTLVGPLRRFTNKSETLAPDILTVWDPEFTTSTGADHNFSTQEKRRKVRKWRNAKGEKLRVLVPETNQCDFKCWTNDPSTSFSPGISVYEKEVIKCPADPTGLLMHLRRLLSTYPQQINSRLTCGTYSCTKMTSRKSDQCFCDDQIS